MDPACPVCQSPSLHWLLHRVHGRGTHHSHRAIRWQCRACGHEWEVPIDPSPPDPLPRATPP